MISDLEARVSRKLMLRIIPFVMLLYFVSFLDRVNVGFAAMSMNKAIGLRRPRSAWVEDCFLSVTSCSRCRRT